MRRLSSLTLVLVSLVSAPIFAQREEARSQLLWADADGDGHTDALLWRADGSVRFLQGVSSEGFEDRTVEVGLASLDEPRSVAWGDVEGDGRLELLVVDAGGRTRLLVREDGGVFTDGTILAGLPERSDGLAAEWVDFDGDGRADLLWHTLAGELLFRGDGGGLFAPVELGVRVAEPAAAAAGPLMRDEPDPAPHSPAPAGSPAGSSRERSAAARSSILERQGETSPRLANVGPMAGPLTATAGCVATLRDAATGGCLTASSEPGLGQLFPLAIELFVDAATRFVGVGTLQPETRLHVEGGSDVRLTGGGYLQLGDSGGRNVAIDDNELQARNNGAPASFVVNNDGGNVVLGGTGSTGRVGVGTSSPLSDLHVRGEGTLGSLLVTPDVTDASAEVRLTENHTATLGVLMRYDGTKNDLEVRGMNASGETDVHLSVDRDSGIVALPTSSAKLGVGTASPSAKLHVADAAGGDGSVLLPKSSIGAFEIEDEIGVASDLNTSGGSIPSNTLVTVAARTIQAPTPGYVLALGTAQLFPSGLFGGGDTGLCIEQDGGPSSPFFGNAVQDSQTVTVQGLFSVSAGSHTFRLNAFAIGGDVGAEDIRLTLLFVPTGYGTVEAD